MNSFNHKSCLETVNVYPFCQHKYSSMISQSVFKCKPVFPKKRAVSPSEAAHLGRKRLTVANTLAYYVRYKCQKRQIRPTVIRPKVAVPSFRQCRDIPQNDSRAVIKHDPQYRLVTICGMALLKLSSSKSHYTNCYSAQYQQIKSLPKKFCQRSFCRVSFELSPF